jgi:hypothetical protein
VSGVRVVRREQIMAAALLIIAMAVAIIIIAVVRGVA